MQYTANVGRHNTASPINTDERMTLISDIFPLHSTFDENNRNDPIATNINPEDIEIS